MTAKGWPDIAGLNIRIFNCQAHALNELGLSYTKKTAETKLLSKYSDLKDLQLHAVC